MRNDILNDILKIEEIIAARHKNAALIKACMDKHVREIDIQRKNAEHEYNVAIGMSSATDRQSERKLKEKTNNSAMAVLESKFRVQAESIRERYAAIIKNDIKYIAWLDTLAGKMRSEILQQYGQKPAVIPTEAPDLDEIRSFYEKIIERANDSFWKRSFHSGGNNSPENMQRDFVIMVANSKCYLENEIRQINLDCDAEIDALSSQFDLERNRLIKAAEQELQNKRNHISQLEQQYRREDNALILQEKEARDGFFSSPLISGFSDRINKTSKNTGYHRNDWSTPVCNSSAPTFAFGQIQVPVTVKSTSLLQSLAGSIPDHFSGSHFKVPALFSNLSSFKLYIQCTAPSADTAAQIVQYFLLQKLRSNPLNRVQVFFADPRSRGKNLGCLIDSDENNQKLGIRCKNDKSGIIEMLEDIVSWIDAINASIAAYTSLYAHNQAPGTEPIKETVLVLNDLEHCIDQGTMPLLKVIWENAGRCGIDIIFSSTLPPESLSAQFPHQKMDFSFLDSPDRYFIQLCNKTAHISTARASYAYLPPQIKAQHLDFLRDARIRAENSLKVENAFKKYFDAGKKYPYRSATNGIHLPILVRNKPGASLTDFVIGTNISTHTLVTGSTASGKSTFLHMLISSVLMNYHPDDVALWLIDYGKVEFADYLQERPAHIRFLALEKSESFTFSFLEHLKLFFSDREKKMQACGCSNIQEYRAKFGERSMPRILLIVDEFHVMTQHVQLSLPHKTILENALAEYRKFGLSCIFSNQTISGLVGLTQAAQLQIRNRVALANSVQEMKSTLAVQSDNYTQEILLNMERSVPGEIWFKEWVSQTDFRINSFMALYISKEERKKVVQASISRGDVVEADKDVFVLDGTLRHEFSQKEIGSYLISSNISGKTKAVNFYIGTPTTIQHSFSFGLVPKYNNNVLLAGRDISMALDILCSMLYCAVKQNNVRVVVFAEPSDEMYLAFEQRIDSMLSTNGVEIYSDYADICKVVHRLHHTVKSKTSLLQSTVVFWFGYSDLFDEFSVSPPKPKSMEKTGSEKQAGSLTVSQSRAEGDNELAEMAVGMGISIADMLSFLSASPVESDSAEESVVYNANQDIFDLFSMGGKYGLFHVIPIEYASTLSRIRGFNISNFIHRIAMCMSREESFDWGLRDYASTLTEGVTALYTDGITKHIFKPYYFDFRE